MRRANFWPTPGQHLLLGAALSEREGAIAAWQAWLRDGEGSELDAGSQRLAPLVYFNLSRLGIADPALNRFKGLYRHTWYRNQKSFQPLSRLLLLLEQNGIPTMVLKGIPLTLTVYRDMGVRPMADFDIAIRPESSARALELLQDHGWRTTIPKALLSPEKIGAIDFAAPDGTWLDLHFSFFHESFQWAHAAPFWDAAARLKVGEAQTLRPSATDHLLHTLAHGARSNPVPPIRWIADAVSLMRGSEAIDWDRLREQAEALGLLLVVQRTLAYLGAHYGGVPQEVLENSALHRAGIFERLEFRLGRERRVPLTQLGAYVRKYEKRGVASFIGALVACAQDRIGSRNVIATLGFIVSRLVMTLWREYRAARAGLAVRRKPVRVRL